MLTKKSMEKHQLSTISEDDSMSMMERNVVKPKIVTHNEEDGTRISNKKNPSLLPYIHRNPAL